MIVATIVVSSIPPFMGTTMVDADRYLGGELVRPSYGGRSGLSRSLASR